MRIVDATGDSCVRVSGILTTSGRPANGAPRSMFQTSLRKNFKPEGS